MSHSLILSNARIVTATEVIAGSLRVEDGVVTAIDAGPTAAAGAVDCQGDYLLPGLVELHTDNLERHFTPRPGVRWHAVSACLSHDAQMAAAGVTTVFDAVSLGDMIDGSARQANLDAMIGTLGQVADRGWFKADHRLHLRCEVSAPSINALFDTFVDTPRVGIVSLMDHTPGQRQFVREDKYLEYYMGKYGFTHQQMAEFTARQQELSARHSAPNRRRLAAACRDRGMILATHDDATAAHVDEAVELGIHFSEFPTTIEAARHSHLAGMMVLMGGPNLVRGGSHSGNVAALDLVRAGCLDILSSDYVPASLLHGLFQLHHGDMAMPLPRAVALGAANPARVAGLDDRGRIGLGLRADLIRVLDTGDAPVVRAVWRQGWRVA